MANPNLVLQWNCNGLQSKYNDLSVMVAKYKPAIICLQEIKLKPEIERSQKDNKTLPYSVMFQGYVPYFRCIQTGQNGVAIYVQNEIAHSQIKLNSKWQALAVRATFQGKQLIVSNHYTPGSSNAAAPSKRDLQNIIEKFDKPFIMCGDFNAHNTLWSARRNDARGLEIEEFMFENDLGLLNSNVNTRWDERTKTWSLLDLSIIHPDLYLDFECEVLNDKHDSDHCPIIIKMDKDLLYDTEKRPRWNFKKANWESFKRQ